MEKREIKFRAWDEDSKKMFEDVGLTSIECIAYKHSNKMTPPEEDWRFGRDTVTIMQYTGLKDKKGKDIYEGDILEHITDKNITIKKVVYDNQHGAFILKCPKFWQPLTATYGDDEMYADTYVIVGNVYENPELLKA